MTLKSNDDKHPGNITIVEETRMFNKYKSRIGNTFSVYTYSDRYANNREDLFAIPGVKAVGSFMTILGLSMVLVPIMGSRRNRLFY